MAVESSLSVNGNGVTNETRGDQGPLKILVAGAGIGGLTAAIALRQQGHHVEVFEQSELASELGAAVHLAPNANGILRRLGVFAEIFGSNLMQRLTEYTYEGQQIRSMGVEESSKLWQHPWHLAHRVKLHSMLKQVATTSEGKGTPVKLRKGQKIVDVDPSAARVTLKSGETFSGDLVVGADGVHSMTRSKVIGPDVKPFGCGQSAFRFLIPSKAAEDDPETSKFVQIPGELTIWYAKDRRIVMYPTSDNQELNFVCIHPDSESEAGDGWNQGGNLTRMLEVYKEFDPALIKMLSKADHHTLKVWKLLDMKVMPTWVKDKLALIGDAAHPFLPHQGQGAGQAMEDAAALAVVLPLETPREEINERLKLYEKIRHERATKIQTFSRMVGEDSANRKLDMIQFSNYNFGHDEWDNATQKLREWQWNRTPNMYWRMPIVFGPMPGPRQDHFGRKRSGLNSTFTTASIKFRTSRTVLQNLFPRHMKQYRFKSPGTVAYASFSQTTLNKMQWLGGSGYRHIGLYVHGVEYEKDNGEILNGTYMPLLFESLTDPIVSGREELGMPKLYTSIDVYRREKSYRINTGWEGAIWGNFVWEGLEESKDAESGSISGEADDGVLVYRYMPRVGRQNKGKEEAMYPVFDPFKEADPPAKVQRVWKAKKASFKIDPLDWDALPTLHHVISRLAEIPVYEVVGAKVVEGTGVNDVSAARPIE